MEEERVSLPRAVVKAEEEVEALIFDGAELVDIHNVGIPQQPLSLTDVPTTSQVHDEHRRCLATFVYLKSTRSNNSRECSTGEINLSDAEPESTGYQEQPLTDNRHAGIITHQPCGLQSGKRKTFAPSSSQMDRPVICKEVRLKKRRLHTMMRPATVRRLSEDEDYEEYYDEELDAVPDYVIYSSIRRLDRKVEVIQRQVSDLRQGKTEFFAKQRQVLASLSNGYAQKPKKKSGLKSAVNVQRKRVGCSRLTDPSESRDCTEPVLIQVEDGVADAAVDEKPNVSACFPSTGHIQESLLPSANSAAPGPVPPYFVLDSELQPPCQRSQSVPAAYKMSKPQASHCQRSVEQQLEIKEDSQTEGNTCQDVELVPDCIDNKETSKQDPAPQHSSFDLSKNSFGFLGNPERNVKIPGTFILKASQKTQPKLAARYLARNLFTDEALVTSSIDGSKQHGMKSLDPNKLGAVREFLSQQFPHHDLTEVGKDWKACISSINSMISVTRRRAGREHLSNEKASTATVSPSTSDSAVNGQLWWLQQNSAPLPSTLYQKPFEKLECLGRADRKVQLPASVIRLAKQRARPELAARFLIRHLFPDSILLRSNVYGAIRKGKAPLDCNKINAIREFLADHFPGFDLTEDGKDWKVCVDAINGVIRCLRYELKKTPQGRSFLKHYSSPLKTQTDLE
ncbi:BEN domain-containing protein 2-like isoform X2 [Stegostoma tigrinum]|uniref:BEN domain-containing protein 2-like isoform X2 n=1 Tax=Stegostoma tigrinum TaxID=3053191 RepID=UPI00286FC07B|nr:BEN domain-containing protein 2-like isoform X2 [Stegostoma tigrinum]